MNDWYLKYILFYVNNNYILVNVYRFLIYEFVIIL